MHVLDDSPPVKPGELLAGKYRVERVLGAGGMGVVVAAMHTELETRVALKFLLPSTLANAAAVGRFVQEARAVVRLKSEHVARVTDVGRLDNGAPYIVMEYLEGHDLGTVLERGPLAVSEAVDYLLQACEAVAEAHALGIVHRDLKPRNMFVTAGVDGRPFVKVLDFGISKFTSPAGAQSQPQLSLTRTHEVMGSPMYMSPEQLRSSRAVDERTDIWSMGVILYEMLTGRVPFEAETVTELCAMLLQDAHAPVLHLRPDVPPGIAAAVDRCLQKSPDARFSSVAELAAAVAPFGAPDARDRALRVQTIRGGRPPIGSLADASGPLSRVAVTGGTSVSWGDTQLAPLRQRRTRILSALAMAAGASVFVAAAVAWRAQGADAHPASPMHGAAGAVASGAPPPLVATPSPTASPPETSALPAPLPPIAPATTDTAAPPASPPRRSPRVATPATATPGHRAPTAPATPAVPAANHPSGELPSERE